MRNAKGVLHKILAIAMLFSIAGCSKKEPHLLIAEYAKLSTVDLEGNYEIFMEGSGKVRAVGEKLFRLNNREIIIFNSSGKELRRVSIPEEVLYTLEFVVIPDGRFAFLDNRNDAVYFVSAKGKHIKTVSFNDTPDSHWQNMKGIVVDNKLIVSENGNGQLIEIDISTYKVSIFRDFNVFAGLGAIAYAEGRYYICMRREIYTFMEDSEDFNIIASTPESNLTGIAVMEGRLFAVVNGMSRIEERSLAAKRQTTKGALYEIDIETGQVTLVKDNLNYPDGLEVIMTN